MPALGEEFRSAREARGLSLSDVAEAIHIRSVYLAAIENDDWPAIGAPVYVRGFLRTYARFLGLSAEDAVTRFNDLAPPDRPASTTAGMADDGARSGPSVWAMLATLLAVLLVVFVGYEWWQYAHATGSEAAGGGPQPAATAAGSGTSSATAAPSAMPSATVAPAVAHELVVRLVQRSWLRVVVDGTTRLEGIFPAGTARTFTGNTADVRAGNAAGVTVSTGGRPAKAMGRAGDVVEQRYTL